MMNFTFKLADSKGDEIKPPIFVQVKAEDLASAKTKVDQIMAPTYGYGPLVSAQEIPELESE